MQFTHLLLHINILNFIYLFLGVLGLGCCMRFFLVVVSGCYSLAAVHRLLIAVAYCTGSRARVLQ